MGEYMSKRPASGTARAKNAQLCANSAIVADLAVRLPACALPGAQKMRGRTYRCPWRALMRVLLSCVSSG
eukprot:3026368-Pleurochrysis_carterae.AAC.1